jgi:hypothetical protein
MEQHALKYVHSCCNTKTTFYLETSGGQNPNLYLNFVHLSTPALIRHLWELKKFVSLHMCLLHKDVPVVAAVGLVLGRRGRPEVNVVKLSFFGNEVAP